MENAIKSSAEYENKITELKGKNTELKEEVAELKRQLAVMKKACLRTEKRKDKAGRSKLRTAQSF